MTKAMAILVAISAFALMQTRAARAGRARIRPHAAPARAATAHAGHRSSRRRAAATRFFNFDDLLIDGEFRKPATLYTRALRSPRFDRLLRLRKSFLPVLLESLRDPSLRWIP